MAVSGISSAISAVQRQTLALDTAAAKVVQAGLPQTASTPSEGVEANSDAPDGLAQGMVDVIVATRMLGAALRLAEMMNENVLAGIQAGGYLADAA